MKCPCGGDTYVADFEWPGKDRQWFLRCEVCKAVSPETRSTPEEAASLSME